MSNQDVLKSYGIAVKDNNGNLRSTYEILADLKPIYDKLGSAEQAELATTLAGVNQRKILTALMINFKTAVNATTTATQSMGSAEEENAKRASSLESKTNNLRAEFEKLVVGDGGLQSFAKLLLDIANVGMKALNTEVGKTVLTFTAFVGVITALNAVAKSTIGIKVAQWFIGIADAVMLATSGTIGWGMALTALGLNPTMLAIAGIATAVIVAKKAFDHFNVTLEEQRELVDSTTSKIKELQTEYDKLSSKKNLNESEKERLGLLEAELKNLKEIKEIELEREYIKYQQSDIRSTQQRGSAGGTRRVKTSDQKITSEIDYDIQTYDELSSKKAKTLEEDNKLRASKAENIKQLISEQQELTRYKDILNEEDKARLKKINAIIKEYNANNKSTDATKKSTDAIEEEGEGAEEARTKLEELQDSLNAISGMSLTGLTDAFDLMRNAQDEMNSSAGLTAETFEQMMGLGSEYLAVLLDQTGALDTTTNAQIALYNAKIDEMVLTASSNQVKLAETEITKNGAGAYANLTQAISNNNAVKMEGILLEAQEKGVQGTDYNALVSRINAIKQWGAQAKNSIKINNGFVKSTKSSTKANKENSDSLNDLKKSYEKVINYINNKVDDQIDKLKELKDTALDSIDAQIDKLNEQKDAEEKGWNAKIDALNAQNDAIEQQIELEQLQANLAMARNKKVLIYREGRGFGYESDMGAINEAQKALDEFNRKKKFDDEVKQLENFRDLASQNYDKQIADLEKYRKSVESNYDAQIKYYEDWKKSFKDSIDAYENEQNRLLALQLTGIDFEKANWQARLNNLASFVSSWNALQSKMTNTTASSGGSSVSAPPINSGSVTGGGGTYDAKTLAIQQFMDKVFGIKTSLSGVWDNATTEAVKKMQKQIGLSSPNGLYNRPTYLALAKYMAKHNDGRGIAVPMYASGIASVPDNQMALIGDDPNYRELTIGSKLNGTMTKLSKGSQVVDAKTTRQIIGLSNSINGSGASYNTYEGNQPITINNLNLELKGVTDGEGFSKYITHNLRNEIYQQNKTRR